MSILPHWLLYIGRQLRIYTAVKLRTVAYSFNIFFAFQESVRKAADLTLKTLSKVKNCEAITTLASVCTLCSYLLVRILTGHFLCRCALVCVSLQALQPRELWQHCFLPCWKKALSAMSQRSAHSGSVSMQLFDDTSMRSSFSII